MIARSLQLAAAVALMLVTLSGAVGCKKYYTRDVDPERAGKVRALGPESQDAIQVADMMVRSIEADGVLRGRTDVPVIAVLPMRNNTRFAFNSEVFTNLLRSELRKQAKGKYQFVSRDISADVLTEREMKRDGSVDYAPGEMTNAVAGAQLFLVGSANGLSAASKMGQSDTIVYEFRLVDAETTLDLWQDTFITKKEGKDDLIYR